MTRRTVWENRAKRHFKVLGMSQGGAANRLRKSLLFSMAEELGRLTCHQCGKQIETVEEFSIEHKTPWEHSEAPFDLFFDLKNIAFSHLECNCQAGRERGRAFIHGSTTGYHYGCKCGPCVRARRDYNAGFMAKWRASGKDKSRKNFKGM